MSAVRGSEVIIKRYNGSIYVTVGALRTKTLNLNGNKINVTTADDVGADGDFWNTYIAGPKEFAVTGDAIAKATNKAIVQAVFNDFRTDTVTSYQVIVPYLGTFTCNMIVDDFSYNSPYDDVLSFNLSISANAAPTFVAEP